MTSTTTAFTELDSQSEFKTDSVSKSALRLEIVDLGSFFEKTG